jgi:DMSO/TMAO reductase YedYZ molybdopterin-dependent catalytic subunit
MTEPTPLRQLESLPVHPSPDVDPHRHELRIGGAVRVPAVYRASELARFARTTVTADFACLEGWVVPEQRWGGVALKVLLDLAMPFEDARWVELGSGHFTVTLPLADTEHALLATELGDEELPVEHGGPVRLLVPGGECYTSIKWLDHIALITAPREGTAPGIARARIGLD